MMDTNNTEPSLRAISERIEWEGGIPDKPEDYLLNYERFFGPLRNDPVILLELGVFEGKSLQMWRNYFSSGLVVGVDENYVDVEDSTGRIRVFQGLQQDSAALDRIAGEVAPQGFDIIIDDASHVGELTRIAFWHLFEKHLKPGGYYIIEDWRTGYWATFQDGHRFVPPRRPTKSGTGLFASLLSDKRWRSHSYGMVSLVKELVDELGIDMITNPERGASGPQRFPRFQFMHVTPGQVFFRNRRRGQSCLRRVSSVIKWQRRAYKRASGAVIHRRGLGIAFFQLL